ALGRQRRSHPLAICPVAAADHEACHTPVGEHMGDGLAQALGAAGDDGDLAGEGKLVEAPRIHVAHSRIVKPAAPKASTRCRRPMAEYARGGALAGSCSASTTTQP